MGDAIQPFFVIIVENTEKKGKFKKDKMKNVNMVFLPRGNQDGQVFRLRAPYSPAFPSWFVHDSGSSGFRSRHGCGAAGAFYPSSSHPSFLFIYCWRSIIKRFPSCQEIKQGRIAIPPLDGVSSLFQTDSDSMPEMAVTDFSGMSI